MSIESFETAGFLVYRRVDSVRSALNYFRPTTANFHDPSLWRFSSRIPRALGTMIGSPFADILKVASESLISIAQPSAIWTCFISFAYLNTWNSG